MEIMNVHYSIKTMLMKVLYDLLLASDQVNFVTAFDNAILFNRLENFAGVKGMHSPSLVRPYPLSCPETPMILTPSALWTFLIHPVALLAYR